MPRDHGRIRWAIWSDDDFRALRGEDQRLFMLLLSQPGLSYAGVVPYTITRWARLASDSTVVKLRKSVNALEADRFVVLDESTEELLVRSFIRHDGLLDSPNICRAAVRDFTAVASPLLRAVIVCEVVRLMDEDPRLGADRSWDDVLIPWLNRTLPQTFGPTFPQTLTGTQMQTLETVEKEALDLTISLARAAPTPTPTPSPRRRGRGSVEAFCEVHHQAEPCGGCAADRKAARG